MERDEAIGAELLGISLAWPLAGAIADKQTFSTRRGALHDRLARKDRFTIFQEHDFRTDRLSESVQERATFEETYAAEVKVMSDHAIPSAVLDAHRNCAPQFTLRNIGRMEMNIEPDDPLPLERTTGITGRTKHLTDEVRTARIPEVEFAQVWSAEFVGRVRDSFRRIFIEDPWPLRFGAEVRANHDGPMYSYIVEGTHPDDLPDSPWGPDTIPVPESRAVAPRGTARQERATTVHDIAAMIEGANR